jgi:glutamyl-tRNA(Gln) amidotransferase subunit E
VNSLVKKYDLNKKLANQIFDSDYLNLFEEIASETKIEPTFIASKLTEDLTSLQRQGLDVSLLTSKDIKDVFKELDKGSTQKEAVVLLFEELIKANSQPNRKIVTTVNERISISEVIQTTGVSSVSDEELSKGLDRIINNNITIIKEKGMNALSTLMGRAMAEYRGKANGQKINSMLKDKMSKMVNK